MAGELSHSPSEVIAKLLEDLGLATVGGGTGSWPVYVGDEPSDPDDCMTVYDTAGVIFNKTMPDAEVQEHHGVQIRLRAGTHKVGFFHLRAVAVALDQVYQRTVTMRVNTDQQYLVHSVGRKADVIPLGKETPTSRRRLFTLNLTAVIRRVN